MAFVVAKTVQILLLPPASLLILMLGGALVYHRRRAAAKTLIALGAVLLYLLSLPLTADLLIRPLERFAPPLQQKDIGANAVVVLGSGVRDLSWIPATAAPSETALCRLVTGIETASFLNIPLVLSGGSGEIASGTVREADALAELAVRLGVPRERIRIDPLSRNTRENASLVRAIVGGDDIVLVTSAFHMRRAEALFAREGFRVIPAPTCYRAETRPASLGNLLPRAGNLETSSLALSEYLSTAWYRFRGLI